MCGIAGLLKFDGGEADPNLLGKMIAMLSHRGPDAHGIHAAGTIGLAHSRLSIIDLQCGAQPMSTVDGRLWITFNGEIFNYLELKEELRNKGHHFATHSDTEVILNAYREYGEDCVNQFNGQWAFGIWDTAARKLFLSRDRAGVRPLFYTETAHGFAFASEIKALLACPEVPREIDPYGMDQIFTFWVPIPPRTVFKSIRQLPPGHSLTIQNNCIRVKQYWSMSFEPDERLQRKHERELADNLLDLLHDATRIRLRSDVPVGAYLSGGIDSTLTTALVRRIAHDRLRSFSITFDDSEFDESRYQQEAGSFLGTQHSNISCSHNDIVRVFPEVIRHAEQPVQEMRAFQLVRADRVRDEQQVLGLPWSKLHLASSRRRAVGECAGQQEQGGRADAVAPAAVVDHAQADRNPGTQMQQIGCECEIRQTDGDHLRLRYGDRRG